MIVVKTDKVNIHCDSDNNTNEYQLYSIVALNLQVLLFFASAIGVASKPSGKTDESNKEDNKKNEDNNIDGRYRSRWWNDSGRVNHHAQNPAEICSIHLQTPKNIVTNIYFDIFLKGLFNYPENIFNLHS